MKLAVFRWHPDRVLMGLVDEEGEAVMAPLLPDHPENEPHAYEADPDRATIDSGPLCRCGRPRGHQVHRDEPEPEPTDQDQAPAVLGPIQVVVHDPVEIYSTIQPVATELGTPGFAVVKVPVVWGARTTTMHYERSFFDGCYAYEPEDLEEGQELEPVVAEYKAARQAGAAVVAAVTASRGRRRIETPTT